MNRETDPAFPGARPAGLLLCSLLWALLAMPAAAEDEERPACHTDSIRQLEFPPPPLMDGLGSSVLEVDTAFEEAQAYLNQGIRALHSFWNLEAYRAFKRAAELDPEMVMAWWGVHRATRRSSELEDEKEAAYEKIQELRDTASEQEKYYLRLADHHEDKEGEDRRKAVVSEWEALVDRFPDDVEAKLFLALAVMAGWDEEGRPRPNQLYSLMLLRDTLREHPEHPAAHHYWIHAVENGPRPEEGLTSADRLADLAPKAGHLVHMPGHIYYKVGDYEKAYAAFSRGREVDRAYLRKHGMKPVDHWNYVHNVSYLVATCAESGRYGEGLELAREVIEIALDDERKMSGGTVTIFYQGWASLVKLHTRFGNWSEAASALDEMAANDTLDSVYARYWIAAYQGWVLAMEALGRGDLDAARASADFLDATLFRYERDKESDEVPKEREEDPLYAPWAGRQLEIFSLELRGLIAERDSRHEDAVALLERAVEKERKLGSVDPPAMSRPVSESLAAIRLEAGEWQEARAAYEDLLERRPGSGHALYGLARTRALAGETEEARAAYVRFLEAWGHADEDLPAMKEARAFRDRCGRDAR